MSAKTEKKQKPPANAKELDAIQVRLKPIFGIEPIIYVPVAWIMIVFALVFFLLVLPGIRRNGTWVTVYSDPPNASVIVDGTRLGHSYKPVFVKKGMRKFTIRRPGFQDHEFEARIKGRILASRLFPRHSDMEVILTPIGSDTLMTQGIEAFSAWSAIGTPKDRYAIPPTLTILGRNLMNQGNTLSPDDIESLARAILPMATNQQQLADMNRLFYSLVSGAPPNPLGLTTYAIQASRFLQSSGMNMDVNRMLENKPIKLEQSAREVRDFYESLATQNFPIQRYGQHEFIQIPAMQAPIGDIEMIENGQEPRFGAIPAQSKVDRFLISTEEVSNADYAQFVRETPYWALDNRDNLQKDGMVDENYLQSWDSPDYLATHENYPVIEISWHAAMAYTRWLSDQLFPNKRQTVRLPKENEWEIAARINGIMEDISDIPGGLKTTGNADRGRIGLLGMNGNVREWGLNPFRYYENGEYLDPRSKFASHQRAVRGGAFIDDNLAYPSSARGMLDAGTTSPVLGFRLVIAPEQQD